MTNKNFKVLEQSIIEDEWYFSNNGAKTLTRSKDGLEIWLDNIPVLDLSVYKPAPVKFSITQKIKLYRLIKLKLEYISLAS